MRVAICEDRQDDCAVLRELVSGYLLTGGYDAQIEDFENGEALIDAFSPGKYQIIFMDIFLGGKYLDGIGTARKIRESDRDAYIIFTTISEDHHRPALGAAAIDYIVKPVEKAPFDEAMFRCRNQLEKYAKAIVVSINRVPTPIRLREIQYAEITNKNIILHTFSGEVSPRMTLSELTDMLDMDSPDNTTFLQCHKSYVVNMANAAELRGNSFIMNNGDIVPVGRKYAAQSRAMETRYIFSRGQ